MWRYARLIFRVFVLGLSAAFLHYTLPQHDVARITDAYPKRVNFGENRWFYAGAGNAGQGGSRDVFFIAAILANGKPMEYRNEDTGWGWPPYFKFDTASLQTRASDLKSTAENPRWVVIRHYGWRSNLYSIYPNALAIWEVDGPDVRIIPWFNIVFLTILFATLWAIRVRWRRFRAARIDPRLEALGDMIHAAGERMAGRRRKFLRWLRRR